MSTRVEIVAGEVHVEAELNDGETGRAVAAALPIRSTVQRWGEEIYFRIEVEAALEAGAKAEVSVGDLAYWPTGQAFCMFFGATPVSEPGQIRAASAVTIVGKMTGDFSGLGKVGEGAPVRIERC